MIVFVAFLKDFFHLIEVNWTLHSLVTVLALMLVSHITDITEALGGSVGKKCTETTKHIL